jgi:exopolyphosphatase
VLTAALLVVETELSRHTRPKILTLDRFLRERKRHPTHHFVIGNEAGDADTIVSAIALAYIESITREAQATPVVAIPKYDFQHLRPDVNLLLRLAGISNAADRLLFVDDPVVTDTTSLVVTLVDHNIQTDVFESKSWSVVEIVDHHEDEGLYLDTCSGAARNIAFSGGEALVASACTLVAERLEELRQSPFPASVAVLLLGVILIDSVNLSVEVGKVTQRDRDAVENLLRETNWDELPIETQTKLDITPWRGGPDPTTLFDLVQNAKYDPAFWLSLSVRDALRLDYKDFSYDTGKFGISSVLIAAQDFVQKGDLVNGITAYMAEQDIYFLGIMFAFVDNGGHLQRQLALCGTDQFSLNNLVAFLELTGNINQASSASDDDTSLDLAEFRTDNFPPVHSSGSTFRFYNQLNVKPSRKQIGPILQKYFEQELVSDKHGER